ncbi:hypothetical protein HNR23_003419 [Nocardiopsis mwathae]|uniref:Uncharacterized protein n=1 Tax=Nocardiopsis mwathae TaxID=1472723 RepID=A0A7X0D7U0_9ACTN|nr:hypothetical protein [Nocardiopsis mwathae]MBB6173359.1 hypothetical protein [Nocardiopsis mwathae]
MRLDQPIIRGLRAGLFATVCVAVSAGLHVSAGGAPVDWRTLGPAVLIIGAVGYALAGGRRGLGQIMAAAFTAQYGLHHLFGAGAAAPSATPAAADPAGGTLHHTMDGGPGLAMLLVHTFAALVTAWWLERGESDLAELLHLLGAHLPVLLALPRPFATPPLPKLRYRPTAPRPVERLLGRTIRRRGPPGPSRVFHGGRVALTP